MDSWGTETEMICSNSFLDEKTGSGLGSSLPSDFHFNESVENWTLKPNVIIK